MSTEQRAQPITVDVHPPGDDRPPGWDGNPSAWSQRLPIVVLALIGVFVAGWLALYQQEIVHTVWEPFFPGGTETIVRESGFSKFFERFPVGDAALGAFGYLADAVTGVIGGTKRWRTMPWIVVIFGVFVGPFGVLSIMLVVMQPVLYSAFCTLCLASAVISLAMIGPAVDEVLASMQYLRDVRDDGGSVWSAFWGNEHTFAGEAVVA
ncbi:vitamin K epoxide reductase family protein [Acidimicrobiia bacterium EGI L10123]|uniref:vitamin K epoxide reductase family protein n=1 Tax=Salinilacustrithrix flava TaxID=2957203 RepID=UPI003D7C1A27|nr:vitamin K epoxide reductase family protein [Acidimicrobiia bacterium EGI L10123]